MRERVLLVDDEPTVCEVLELVLQPQGFETVSVESCAAARAEVRRAGFVAALIDKNLPDGSGVELLEELRGAVPDTALLIMTGYSSFDTAVMAMRMGASDYLVKPFATLDDVAVRVRRAIDDLAAERKRLMLEAELRAGIASARNELSAVFEAVAEPLLVLDLSGRVVRHNGAAAALFTGLTAGVDLPALDDRDAADAIRRAAAGEVVRRERVYRRSAQGAVTLTATLAPIRDHRGEVVALVESAVSIDETLRAQRALHQADKMATLGALAATLAHELANPIGCALSNMSILGGIDEGGRVKGTTPEEAGEILVEVRASLEHARDIIRRTREFASPNQQARGPVRLHQVITDAIRFVGPQLTHKAAVAVEVDPALEVLGERTGLVQVLMNLLVNAAHALRGRPEPRVTLRATPRDGEVLLTLEDTGCGIPEEELDRIWDRFFTTKPASEGTGLGLAVCRDLIRWHGGAIRVESTVGRGTRFEIRLPALQPVEPARVLVVDDDPLVLQATARALRGHFEVCTASSAEEALALLADDGRGIQIVLSDFFMPGQSGAELLAQVERRFPEMKRMVMTGHLEPDTRAEITARAHPAEILVKPLEAVVLRSRLMSALV